MTDYQGVAAGPFARDIVVGNGVLHAAMLAGSLTWRRNGANRSGRFHLAVSDISTLERGDG